MLESSRSDRGCRHPLVGELARFRVHIEAQWAESDRPENDINTTTLERLFARRLSEESAEFHEEIYQAVHQELGESANINVEPLVIKLVDSVEVLVILTALGTFLGTYNDLVEKISRATEHTRRIISAVANRRKDQAYAFDVTASSAMSPAGERLASQEEERGSASASSAQYSSAPAAQSRERLLNFVLAYVFIVNTVLLTAVGFILGRQ